MSVQVGEERGHQPWQPAFGTPMGSLLGFALRDQLTDPDVLLAFGYNLQDARRKFQLSPFRCRDPILKAMRIASLLLLF